MTLRVAYRTAISAAQTCSILEGLHILWKRLTCLLHFYFTNRNRPLKGTTAKRDVYPGSSVSTGAKFSTESAPVDYAAGALNSSLIWTKSCDLPQCWDMPHPGASSSLKMWFGVGQQAEPQKRVCSGVGTGGSGGSMNRGPELLGPE